MPSPRDITPERRDQIEAALKLRTLSIPEIAAAFQVSSNTIDKMRAKAGIAKGAG